MLPRLDAATVAPLTPADSAGAAPAFGDGRQAAFQRALQTLIGQQVSAEVLSKYSDGSFLVRVADSAVRMALPANVQVGAELPLTVIAAQPRPTFQLGSGSLPGNPSALVYTENLPAAGTLPEGLYGPPLPGQDGQAAAGRPPAGVPGQPGPAAGDAGAAAGNPAAGAGNAAAPGQAGNAAANAGTAAGLPAGAAPGTAAGAPGLPAELAADPRAAAPGSGATSTPGATPGTAAGANPAAAGTAAGLPAGAAGAAASLAAGAAASAAGAAAVANAGAAVAGTAANAAVLAAGLQASGVDLTRPQRLAATLLGKAPLTPAADLPKLDPSTPAPTLSSAARVLTSLLSAAQGSAATLIGKAALFSDGPPATAQLAQRLGDTIAQSGLFYESHVAEWVRGDRTLADLMQEPQMQRLAQNAETAARAAAGPDLSAAQMINQQLNTNEQSRVQWNGQAWPGQHMQWEIRREQRDSEQGQGNADGPPEPVWRSGVRFRFAMLGEVSATVTVVGDQVHVQMQTGTGDAAATLRAYAGQLEQAMEAAGAPLSSLTISDSEAGDD